MNHAVKQYRVNSNVVVPSGVKSVTVRAIRRAARKALGPNNWGSQENPMLLDAGGSLYSWGFNTNGQVGDSTSVPKSAPTLVVGGLKINQFFQGHSNVFLIDQYNLGYAFGLNTNGELGDNSVASRSSPVAMSGALRWIGFGQMGSDLSNLMGIAVNGQMYASGNNANGQIGDSSTTKKSVPTLVAGGLTWHPDIRCFGNQNGSAWGIASTGALYGWGVNTNGEVGDGSSTPRSSPTLVVGGLTWKQATGVLGAANSMIGLTGDGKIYAWGENSNGQLGDNSVTKRSSPVLMTGGIITAVDIATAGNSTAGTSVVVQLLNGQAYATGRNNHGQLGVGNTQDRSSPTLVIGGLSFQKVVGGNTNAGANPFFVGLTTGGDLYAWGANTSGNLGDGSSTSKSSPTLVVGGLKFSAFSVDKKLGGVRAVTTDGLIYAWGNNVNGQLGDGTVVAKSSPVLVSGSLTTANNDYIAETSFDVTAGTTYALKIQQGNCYFGVNSIGTGPFDFVELEYWQ